MNTTNPQPTMNQIPNIEGTIEGIKSWLEVKSADFVEGYYEGRCDADREHRHQLQKAREEERERIEAIFKKHVPPHAMDLEDSVWLKRLLNKVFQHD